MGPWVLAIPVAFCIALCHGYNYTYRETEPLRIGILAEPEISEFVLEVAEYMRTASGLLNETSHEVIQFNSTGLRSQLDFMQTACDLVKQNLSLLITTLESDAIPFLHAALSPTRIPLISTVATDPDLSFPGAYEYLIKMSAEDTNQGRALADLLTYYGWSRFAILQENSNYGIHGLQEFSRIALVKRWTIVSYQVFSVHSAESVGLDVDEQLLAIKGSGARVVVLQAHAVWAWPILERAKELNMFSYGWVWLVTDGVTLSDIEIPSFDNGTTDDILGKFNECRKMEEAEFVGLLGLQPTVGQGKYGSLIRDYILKDVISMTRNLSHGGIDKRLFCEDESIAGYAMRFLDATWIAFNALDQFTQFDQNSSLDELEYGGLCDGSPHPLNMNGDVILNYLLNIQIDGAMNFINFTENNTPGVYDYRVVNLHSDGWVEVGKWNEDTGITINCQETFPGPTETRPRDTDAILEDAFIEIVTIIEEPFVMLNDRYPEESNEELIGLCIDLIKELSDILHFKYSLHLSKDGYYGARDPKTDTWNGMLKELNHFEADVSISALFITEERLQYFDMTNAFMDLGLDVLIAKEGVDGSPFNFLRPFDNPLWLAILGCNIACGALVACCSYLSPFGYRGRYIQRRDKQNQKYRATRGELTFVNSLWHAFVSLLTQGSNITAIATSARIVAGFWFALCTILLAVYTADLTAYLTVERMFTGIQTLTDLANQQDVKYGTLDGTAIQTFFAENPADPFPRMYKFMKLRGTFVQNASVGVKMVRDSFGIAKDQPGKYALIYDSTVMEYMSRNEPCVTRTLGDIFRKMGYGVALRKNSPYTQAFNEAVLHLREAGVVEALAKKWINGPCPDPNSESENSEAEQLTLDRMGGVFVFFFGGAAVAFVVLILEFIIACHTDIVNDRLHQVNETTFVQHMRRRFNDVINDICHIFKTLVTSFGIFAPSEEKRQKLRGKWHRAGNVTTSTGKSVPANVSVPQPSSMATSGNAFLDLYQKKRRKSELAEMNGNAKTMHVSLTNSDVMMY